MKRDSGYATAAVTALLAGLSLISLMVLQLSATRAELSITMSQTLITDIEIENIFHEVSADLANGKIDMEPHILHISRKSGSTEVSVAISDESTKININDASVGDVTELLESSALKELSHSYSSKIKPPNGTQYNSLKDVFSSSELLCAHKFLTVFRPSSSARATQGSRSAPDGSILTLQLSSKPPSSARTLLATILLTGKSTEPVWVMDWVRITPARNKNCSQ